MPPGDGDKSEEDSDNEEGANVKHLPTTLLQTHIEFKIHHRDVVNSTEQYEPGEEKEETEGPGG